MGQGAKKVVQHQDWKRTRRRRVAILLIGLILIALMGALAYGGFLCPLPVSPSRQAPAAQGAGAYEVIDGDTIRAPYGMKYRLLGFDAPETFQARCDTELALGRRATERLKELLASGKVRVVESGKIDRYGRTLHI